MPARGATDICGSGNDLRAEQVFRQWGKINQL
ncbi:MAG: Uncharacterised protein [Porticoccaceae bacterium UBA1117]|jgi:hypothetical protein|nr:MAG: Uncharacterised protein [Porticoccaceae bacterium UBA1117]